MWRNTRHFSPARCYNKVGKHFPTLRFPHIDKPKTFGWRFNSIDSIGIVSGFVLCSFWPTHITSWVGTTSPVRVPHLSVGQMVHVSILSVCATFSRNVRRAYPFYFPAFLDAHFYEPIMLLAQEFYELTIFICPGYLIFSL